MTSLADFVLSPAYAQAATSPNPIVSFAPLVVLVIVFYFLLIRPQMRRNKEVKQMLGSLSKGDEAVTAGGMAGRIANIGENYVTLEIAEGVSVKVQKSAITSVLPKGTLKTL